MVASHEIASRGKAFLTYLVFTSLSRSAANRLASAAMSSRIRPKAWLSHHRPGTGSFKYHFNVHVHDVVLREGMVVPEGAKFRLVWKRGDKVASSREIAQASPMVFDESLSLVCTMYRDPAVGAYAEKEAAFALHMTGPRAGSATRQVPLGLGLGLG